MMPQEDIEVVAARIREALHCDADDLDDLDSLLTEIRGWKVYAEELNALLYQRTEELKTQLARLEEHVS